MVELDNKELQTLEISVKVTKEYFKCLRDVCTLHRKTGLSMEDIYSIHKIPIDFHMTEQLILTEDELHECMKRTITEVARSFKLCMDETGLDELPLKFLETICEQYDWRDFFRRNIRS